MPHLRFMAPPSSSRVGLVDLEPNNRPSDTVVIGLSGTQRTPCRLDGLISSARYVKVHFYRRALHASGDAAWHSSAKHASWKLAASA
jgi:hypothetical protein